MCFVQENGSRVGTGQWQWDLFVFGGIAMGSATVAFRTNHREDGSVPGGEVKVLDAVVDSFTVCDDDGNDLLPLLTVDDVNRCRDEVLQRFHDEIDLVVDSFGF